MLAWASQASIFCCLDSQGYPARAAWGYDCLLAVGAAGALEAPAGSAFSQLKTWARDRRDWVFGHFAYDLAAETEPSGRGRSGEPFDHNGRQHKPDRIGFPGLYFFVPEIVIQLSPNAIRIGSLGSDQEAIWGQIRAFAAAPEDHPFAGDRPANGPKPAFQPALTRAEYLDRVGAIQRDILRGDCYELNFCQEFAACPVELDPLRTWWSLGLASPNPYSCFYRLGERYLFCASPECYLKKSGDKLLSQPIKGTAARFPGEPATDQAARRWLAGSAKDRSENVMVVDLVRNDLSRVCSAGSVAVEELFGVHAFPQVFQMVSTISGRLRSGLEWPDAIAATFPMGSMTGAPKNRVVRLIECYEQQHRGIFSGAVGYVTPEGDFDFNVVIRSLLYNRADRFLSYQVGSGITFYSDPVSEYEECLLKAAGILRALA